MPPKTMNKFIINLTKAEQKLKAPKSINRVSMRFYAFAN